MTKRLSPERLEEIRKENNAGIINRFDYCPEIEELLTHIDALEEELILITDKDITWKELPNPEAPIILFGEDGVIYTYDKELPEEKTQ